MPNNILVAYDGSDSATDAFELGVTMAKKFGGTLHILTVARPPDFGTEVETSQLIEEARHHCQHAQHPIRKRLAKDALHADFAVVVGHPAEQIVHYADTHDIDHIVVGHRGRTLFERWLIGSVARQVVAYANCSVTVVRHHARTPVS